MKNLRIHSIDALRGVALAGIVLTHMVENYLGSLPPAGVMDATNEGIASGIVNTIVFIFLRGKFFALFSFLFGLSFFIQQERGKAKEQRFSLRFFWRLVLLFAIGTVQMQRRGADSKRRCVRSGKWGRQRGCCCLGEPLASARRCCTCT